MIGYFTAEDLLSSMEQVFKDSLDAPAKDVIDYARERLYAERRGEEKLREICRPGPRQLSVLARGVR